jgi:DNA-binding GntR family transcriptional regulator
MPGPTAAAAMNWPVRRPGQRPRARASARPRHTAAATTRRLGCATSATSVAHSLAGCPHPESRSNARDEHLELVAAINGRATDESVALTVAHNRSTCDRLLACLSEERRRLRGRGLAIIESAAAPRYVPGQDL